MATADTVVIGGGIVGAAAAYELAKLGARPLLLEAERLAYGASGRNLGYVWVHTRRPGPELDLVMWTRRQLPQLAEELGGDFDLRCNGGIIYFFTDEQRAVMREFVERRQAAGVDVQLLDGAQAREMAPMLPESVLGATYCPLDAQVDPAQYVRAFGSAAERAGAEIREGVRVERLLIDGDRVTGVATSEGPIHADRVIVAAGGWAAALCHDIGLEIHVRAMRLQVVSTKPMRPRLEHLLYGPSAVKQYTIFQDLPSFRAEAFVTDAERRHGLDLLESACQRPDGSYLLGCAMDYPGHEWQPSLAGVALVAEGLASSLPELRDAPFDAAWAGVLPFTADNLPVIDRPSGLEGLVIAAGHVFGNGAGPTTGRLVAEMACDVTPSLDAAPYRLDRPSLRAEAAQSVW
jgi:glycine/D-amino acid oxidase-like deaminating enzyme